MTRRADAGAGRAGLSAPEALVALLLGLFVVHLALSSVARLRTTGARLAERADGLVAMRVAEHVLRRDLGHAVPRRDWFVDADSLSLRAFRGTALVCPYAAASDEIVVAYDGDRAPDPAKDSILLVNATGTVEIRRLVGSTAPSGSCGSVPLAPLLSWGLDSAVEPGFVVARLFERGSYHLALSALRYRRGASGRQPLTPEVWADSTAWSPVSGRLRLDVVPGSMDVGAGWSASLAWMDPE